MRPYLLPLVLLVLLTPIPAGAQAPPPAPPAAAPAGRPDLLAALTPEERQRVQAARRTARQDPAVQAAQAQRDTDRPAYRRAMRDAMLRADPTLAPVLAKLGSSRPGRAAGRGADVDPADARRAALLTPEERTKLQAAQQAAQRDPAVVTSREQVKNAATPEARRAARQGMTEAVRSAMLRADPSVGAILEKMRPARGAARSGGAGA